MALANAWGWLIDLLSLFASNLVIAAIILVIGFLVAKVLERLLHRILHGLELNRILKKAGFRFPLEESIPQLIKYFIYVSTVIVSLNQLNLMGALVGLIAIVVILIIITGMVFGLRDFIPNFIAGIRIHRRGFVKEGDRIRVRDIEGEVRDIKLLETRIKTSSGDLLFVPNTMFVRNEVLRFGRKKTMLK
ncbi:mechanosensitive ion channel [Candidatus Woesearchaeota archaeon]|nr:mechanosensitive ion channel [Candidatus Woesearchaeota archaeon]